MSAGPHTNGFYIRTPDVWETGQAATLLGMFASRSYEWAPIACDKLDVQSKFLGGTAGRSPWDETVLGLRSHTPYSPMPYPYYG